MISTGALIIWAGDEVVRGVNPWRRFLGAVMSESLSDAKAARKMAFFEAVVAATAAVFAPDAGAELAGHRGEADL